MRDRRFYGRFMTDIDANVYVENVEHLQVEIPAKIINISEQGFGMIVDDDKRKFFSEGSVITFEFIDTVTYGRDDLDYVFIKKAVVKNISNTKNGIRIGCNLFDREFADYSVKKLVSGYSHLCGLAASYG